MYHSDSLTTFETEEAVLWFCTALFGMSFGAQLKCSCYSCRCCVEFGEDSHIFWQWSVSEDLLGEGDMLGVVFHICMDSFSEKNISQICKNTFQTVILSLEPDVEEVALELMIIMH